MNDVGGMKVAIGASRGSFLTSYSGLNSNFFGSIGLCPGEAPAMPADTSAEQLDEDVRDVADDGNWASAWKYGRFGPPHRASWRRARVGRYHRQDTSCPS